MNINQTNSINFRAQFVETAISKRLFKVKKTDINTSRLFDELKKIHPHTELTIIEYELFNIDKIEHLNVIIKNLNNNLTNRICVGNQPKDGNLINLFVKKVLESAQKNTKFWKKNLQ